MQQTLVKSKDNLLSYALGEKLDIEQIQLEKLESDIKFNHDLIRLRKISKIVFDKDEDNVEKLTTIFSAISSIQSDIVYIFHNKNKILSFYIGVICQNTKLVNDANNTLEKAFKSHFNGCSISDHFNRGEKELKDIESIFLNNNALVTMSTAIPSLKNEDEKKENFVQGMEKFLLAMQDEDYTTVLLAKNISHMIESRKGGYEELYTSLFPLVTRDLTIGKNSSDSKGTSDTLTLTETINNSVTTAISKGNSTTTVKPSIMQKVQMTGLPSSLALAGAAIVSGAAAPVVAVGAVGIVAATAAGAGVGKIIEKENTFFDSKNETENSNDTTTTVDGSIDATSLAKGITKTYTIGESSQVTIKHEDKFIKNKIEAIDMQLERIKQSQNYGMYDFAAYFISDNKAISNTAANIYTALIRGNESFLGHSYTKSFDGKDSQTICKYLSTFDHPMFNIDDTSVSITSMINSKELAISMNLPKKSLHGLYIKESVEFGREILTNDKKRTITIGKNYHLGKVSSHNVSLALNDFSMHTLITGATGSGKSTTTYKLIDELRRKDIKILIIEPTKGEYKHVFGNEKDVSVYGTNNAHTKLLKINPFSFPKEIHILEHIDRLVEIFNACWPMYAAMPAVLKDAILNAYEDCEWDLDDSLNKDNIFPTFTDVLISLENIMQNSSYSDNTKSDYKGALSTRIESLTKGLVGKIFDEDELTDEELFDENVIIDISRVGSSETKSLIMGILLLKLNQHRMATGKMNDDLKHVTILEEAHHLLPRTSKETSSESGNIKGKAVEMLSNAIAEMRTYGEGFIIVDQSPNMLDISAIRNTNTKIIMRLSELDDRKDIGKSATLTDEQIEEIPKLERGVAVVYQNGCEESILCKIEKSNIEDSSKKFNFIKQEPNYNQKEVLTNIVKLISLNKTSILKEEREIIEKDFKINQSLYKDWAGKNQRKIKSIEYINSDNYNMKEIAKLLNYLLNGRTILSKKNNIEKAIEKQIFISNNIFQNLVIQFLIIANSNKEEELSNHLKFKLEQKNLLQEVK